MFNLIINFKSNFSKQDYLDYIGTLRKGLDVFKNNNEITIIFAPSFPYLYLFTELANEYDFVKLAGQDVSKFGVGAFTGNVNYLQLKDFCTYCIVGHSERRKYYKEDTIDINQKISNLLLSKINPIVCVTDLNEFVEIENKEKCIIAFEPFEYIGGKVSAPISVIDNFYVGSGVSNLIYGGSINFENFANYFKKDYIKGFLIGSAGLNAIELLKILQKTNTLL